MTRQETVIKITKITRIIGEMKSQLDLDDEIEFEALDPSWTNIGDWTKEIYQYMKQDPSPLLANLITDNEFTIPVVNYVQSHKQDIDSTYIKVMDNYAKNTQALLSLCEEQREKLKGEYTGHRTKRISAPQPANAASYLISTSYAQMGKNSAQNETFLT